MLICNGKVFTGETFSQDRLIRMEGGLVTETEACLTPAAGETVLDLGGDYLVPGFVDVHIHAYQGHDTMQGETAVRAMSRGLRKQGVAAFCPTTMSASAEDTRRAVEGIRAVCDAPEAEGSRVLGAHMEAPFLCKQKAGAQLQQYFLNPDWEALMEMCGGHPETVRLLTLAPELPGAEALIRRAAAAGIHCSIGHSAADADTVHTAADWGADHSTHLFNAQTPLLHRAPGIPGAALSDERIFCEMICDGIHLHRDIVRVIAAAKGPNRAVVITDAMEAAGMPDGEYQLGGQAVFVREGEARLADGTLAGSVLTMPRALSNLIHRFGISPEKACAMCTVTPAESIGESLCGRLMPGSPAVATRWSPDWKMRSVITDRGEETWP